MCANLSLVPPSDAVPCCRWLPEGVAEVRDLNPRVPTAIVLTEGDDMPHRSYMRHYDMRVSYTRDADVRHAQVSVC